MSASSNHNALSRFLQRLLVRSDLPNVEQEAILGLSSHTSQIPPRRAMVSPGDRVDHACLIVDGLAGRFDQTSDGRRQFTALHLPGDMCDLHSVVAPVSGWGIEALTTTTVVHVPHAELRSLAISHPIIGLAFWKDSIADASCVAKWAANLGRKDARGRLAHLLCELGLRMEQAGLGSRTDYALHATQEQLADVLGLTPVHLNRTLQRLRGERLIRIASRTVHIDDWAGLAAAAQFDEDYLLVDRLPERRAA